MSIDYFVLSRSSEYGYTGISHEENSHYIEQYDLKSGIREILFSWKNLCFLASQGSDRVHINHILPSPDGNSFIFIFRYWLSGKRYDSLIFFDLLARKLKVIIENQTISHYAWYSNKKIFAWIVSGGIPGYYIIQLDEKTTTLVLDMVDGHPNYLGRNAFISDFSSYSLFSKHLVTAFMIDIEKKSKKDLVSISHQTLIRSENRCDMHISLSHSNRFFQLDSMHLYNRRSVIVSKFGGHV